MDSRHARWIALSVFAVLIAGWVLAAVYLTGASAGRPGSPFNLSSKLAADYAADGGERISSLRISIVADLLRDLGIPIEGAGILDDLDSPVPTATARNFAGDPPFTATVTPSQTPTETTEPTGTPTNTPRPPATKTPEPTDTDEPASTAEPTDGLAPSISGGTLSPSPMALSSCTQVITITGLRVVDPAYSSGLKSVQLKYKILGPGSQGYVYSDDLSPPVSGGWTAGEGSTWDAYYDGSLAIEFDVGYAAVTFGGKAFFLPMLGAIATDTPTPTSTPTPGSPPPTNTPGPTATPAPYEVKVWSIAEDIDGNQSFILLGTYTLPGTCG